MQPLKVGHAGQRSSASLDQLKGVRQRVREDRLEDSPGQKPAAEPPRQRPAASTRFDAGEPTGKEPTADLQQALGGPELGESAPQKPRKPAADESAVDDATSRLLRAKRRARKDMDDGSEPRP